MSPLNFFAADYERRILLRQPASSSTYFIAHPEKVTAENIAAAAAAAGKPVRLDVDERIPLAARGPVDTEAAARDFAFRAKVGHREGIGRMIEAIPSGR